MQSLAVGNSEVEGQSRITMVIPGSAEGTSKIIKQLNKLIHVLQVSALTTHARITRLPGEARLLPAFPGQENARILVCPGLGTMTCCFRGSSCLVGSLCKTLAAV